MQITDKDIERVEKLFFPEGGDFKDDKNERYKFIKCIDRSIDVHACPGSGKTTSLLAKLYLLSEKMPFPDGRAICVLTHTNVAIDTIKNRLGTKANRLFQYPNFFGTIQSFVDQFLAIPYFVQLTGRRLQQIDTNAQRRRMNNTFWIKGVANQTFKNLRSYNYSANYGAGIFGYYSYFRDEKGSFHIINSKTKKEINFKKSGKGDWSRREKKLIKAAAIKLKNEITFKQGILSYDDAYQLGMKYLKRNQDLKSIFSKRFEYVFIDEMQDTYSHQLEIINSLFDDTVIVQRIGDLNQAILSGNDDEAAWEKKDESLEITGSWRFSQPIANVLKCVALEPQEDLIGFNDSDIPPHIITCDENNHSEVLEKFIDLIDQLNLTDKFVDTGYPFKAVGWVGKEKETLTIGDYFQQYNKELSTNRRSFPNLITLLACSLDTTPEEFRDNIINGLLETLFLENIYRENTEQNRRHSKTSLMKYIKEKNENLFSSFLSKISEWYLKRTEKDLTKIHEEVKNYLQNELFESLSIEVKKNGKKYVVETNIKKITPEQANRSNIYRSSTPKLQHIDVHVGTVHSVKGETHTATLYLETKYFKTCGNHLLNELLGNPYKGSDGVRKEMCLKIAHVGFSRPTDLLCLALDSKLVEENRDDLDKFGWKIIN